MNTRQKGVVIGTVIVIVLLIGATIYLSLQINTHPTNTINVVASFYPLSYCAKAIGRNHVTVTTLVPPNTDVHLWQPSTSDIFAANKADILLYNGAHLDSWFEDEILTAVQDNTIMVVDTTSNISLLKVDSGVDPHTWISPYMIQKQAKLIFNALINLDPNNYTFYLKQWNYLSDNLTLLDRKYDEELNNTIKDTIFVTHSAFGYLEHRYNFTQEGLIGLSADQQPSAIALGNLIDLMVEYKTYVVYVDPVFSNDYANTLKNTLEDRTGEKVTVLTLYTMLGPINQLDYLQQIECNLINLKIGLEATI